MKLTETQLKKMIKEALLKEDDGEGHRFETLQTSEERIDDLEKRVDDLEDYIEDLKIEKASDRERERGDY